MSWPSGTYRTRVFLLLATAFSAVSGQNLVPNGDFETYRQASCDTCPGLKKAGFIHWEDEAEFYHNLQSWKSFRNDTFSQSSAGYFNSDFFYPSKRCGRPFGSGGSDAQQADEYTNYLHLNAGNKGCVGLYWNFSGDKIGKSLLFNKLQQSVKKGVRYTFKVKLFTGA